MYINQLQKHLLPPVYHLKHTDTGMPTEKYRNFKETGIDIKHNVSTLCLSPENYDVNLRQVFWLILVLAAFPFHTLCNSGLVCQNICRIYSCGYSSCISQDSLFDSEQHGR